MPTKDGFDPAHPLPRFLAGRAELDIGNAREGAVVTASPVFKAGILIAAVAAAGLAVLVLGNPAALFADVSALLDGNAPPPQSTPAVQSAADAPALPPPPADAQTALLPTATDAPAREEVAVSEAAGKDQAETSEPSSSEPSSEALFRQFQAWAAEKDAQAQRAPVQDAPAQAAQDAPAPAAENARAPSRLAQKRRQARAAHNARAEMRAQNPRKEVRRAPSARAEPPVQDARAQAPPAQDTQAPSFLPFFGLRN